MLIKYSVLVPFLYISSPKYKTLGTPYHNDKILHVKSIFPFLSETYYSNSLGFHEGKAISSLKKSPKITRPKGHFYVDGNKCNRA